MQAPAGESTPRPFSRPARSFGSIHERLLPLRIGHMRFDRTSWARACQSVRSEAAAAAVSTCEPPASPKRPLFVLRDTAFLSTNGGGVRVLFALALACFAAAASAQSW